MASTHPTARERGIAAAWGFAEGTVFFVVPDVWLSWLALTGRRPFAASLSALAGALAGGAAVYVAARRLSPQESRRLLLTVPAVSGTMIDRVESESARGPHTMVLGPLRGTPYKIYARTAGMNKDSLPQFLAWSIPARLPRFLAVAGGTAWIVKFARARLGHRPRLEAAVFAAGWIAFYTWFWTTIGREASDESATRDH